MIPGWIQAILDLFIESQASIQDLRIDLDKTDVYVRDHGGLLDGAHAAFLYSGEIRSLITRYKYAGEKSLSGVFAPHLSDLSRRVVPWNVDAVTWVPSPLLRRVARGYNQSEILAKAVAKELGIPARPLLQRRGIWSRRQALLSKKDRQKNAQRTFVCADMRSGKYRAVLLIDDVISSGATAAACADALKRSGVLSVYGIFIASGV